MTESNTLHIMNFFLESLLGSITPKKYHLDKPEMYLFNEEMNSPALKSTCCNSGKPDLFIVSFFHLFVSQWQNSMRNRSFKGIKIFTIET